MASVYRKQMYEFDGSANHHSLCDDLPTTEETIDAINRILKQSDAGTSMAAALPPLDSFPSHEGWGLLISVEGIDFEYEFTRDDLRKVFQRYGRLTGVETLSPSHPYGRVWYRNVSDAKAAIADLDNKVLNGIHGRLRVGWDPNSFNRLNFESTSPSNEGVAAPPSVRKFTCRFDIGIENDKEFQVARRIIGQKGCNMKKIVETSGAKLRLRGKGSGYLEGPLRQESPEPLHLCVSCTTQKGYNDAVKSVTEILEGVYIEYSRFRRSRGGSTYDKESPLLKVVVRDTTVPQDKEEDMLEYPSSPEPVLVMPERRLDSGYWKVPS